MKYKKKNVYEEMGKNRISLNDPDFMRRLIKLLFCKKICSKKNLLWIELKTY